MRRRESVDERGAGDLRRFSGGSIIGDVNVPADRKFAPGVPGIAIRTAMADGACCTCLKRPAWIGPQVTPSSLPRIGDLDHHVAITAVQQPHNTARRGAIYRAQHPKLMSAGAVVHELDRVNVVRRARVGTAQANLSTTGAVHAACSRLEPFSLSSPRGKTQKRSRANNLLGFSPRRYTRCRDLMQPITSRSSDSRSAGHIFLRFSRRFCSS